MLDKTIPYVEIWMARSNQAAIAQPTSKRVSIRTYQSGDAEKWAAIETAVGEFKDQTEAVHYFQKTFIPEAEALSQRMFFAIDVHGEPIGTATAWWKKRVDGFSVPIVHWVAVHPRAQRQGIARQLLYHVLEVCQRSEAPTIYLHTQTWSHNAIALYRSLGFEIIETDINGHHHSDYARAIEILDHIAH
ncbi:GNAT family N-acetyltransferase [Enterococcus sp.]|uniref:GNAT family N-acetyltransferase n=1 Tax=Enterococcus sp. TaxID=35783 RepID=UPI0028AE171F|nr:GNAT family N-acetyltransferase [Enterococcus sp.]